MFCKCSVFASTAFSSCFSLEFCSELVGLLQLYMISSLVFDDYLLWELFQISLLVLEKSRIFHAYSGAKGSLFWLWLRLWHVMIDVILIVCLVIYDVSWLVSNSWECLMCHWNKSWVVFIILKHSIVVFSFDALFGLTWRRSEERRVGKECRL